MWAQKQLSLIIDADETTCKITIESEAWFDNGQKQRIMNFESVFGIYGFDWKITAIFQKEWLSYVRLALDKNDITLGRDSQCSISYQKATVSKRHCRLYKREETWFICNENEVNGTFVNGKRIKEQTLKIGDCIFMAGLELWFCDCFLLACEPDSTSLQAYVPHLKTFRSQTISPEIKLVTYMSEPQLCLPNNSVRFLPIFQEIVLLSGLYYLSISNQNNGYYLYIMFMMTGLKMGISILRWVYWLIQWGLANYQYRTQKLSYQKYCQERFPDCLTLEKRYFGMGGLLCKEGDFIVRLGITCKGEILLHNFSKNRHLICVGTYEDIEQFCIGIVYQMLLYYPYISLRFEKMFSSFWFCQARLQASKELLWIGQMQQNEARYWIEPLTCYSQGQHGYDALIDLNSNKYYSKEIAVSLKVEMYQDNALFSRHFRYQKSKQDNRNINNYLELTRLNEMDILTLRQQYFIDKELKGCIGKRGNYRLYLDLHELHDGPHLLVAGMTGSGKSEWLTGYLLSLAIYYDSCDIQFFFIDFKGGGLSNGFESLAHTTMILTDLDECQIERAIAALQDEIRYRERLFLEISKAYPYPNLAIHDLKRLFRQNKISINLPHLLIVVDEFAELKLLYPEMMQSLIRIARIGRSLGIHLILATQRPGGIVDGQILGNIKAKVCLKVASKQDSYDIFAKNTPTFLTEPGTFYLQRELQGELEDGQSLMVIHQTRKIVFYDQDFIKMQSVSLEAFQTPLLTTLIQQINSVTDKVTPLYYKDFKNIDKTAKRDYQLGYYDDFHKRKMSCFIHDFSKDGSMLLVGANEQIISIILECYPSHQLIDDVKDLSCLTSNKLYVLTDFSTKLNQNFQLWEEISLHISCLFIERSKARLSSRFLDLAQTKIFFENESYQRHIVRRITFSCDIKRNIGILVKEGEVYRCQIQAFSS